MLSIVTPTYNRAHLLSQCYKSLCKQKVYDFEWIVIDDGSTDNTAEEINGFINQLNSFSIIYKCKENGGKHTALNASHDLIHGDYVLILDSDDQLTENAVQTVLDHWNKYKSDKSITMLIFAKQITSGEICAYAEEEDVPVDYYRTKRIRNVSTDCCEVIRAELFKQLPFPVFENEKYIPETVLWYRAANLGKCVYVNDPIYVCEYLEGGLTKSGRQLRIRNPKGGMFNSYLRMNPHCSMKERLKGSVLYTAYGRFAHEKYGQILKQSKPYYFMSVIGLVPGSVLYKLWRRKYESRN